VTPWTPDSEVSRRVQLAEMLVFVFLIAPSLAFSFLAASQGTASFELTAFATILRDLALVCLIAYFVRRNGEPVARIGWNFRNWPQEVALGLLLFIPLSYGAGFIQAALSHIGLSTPPKFLASLTPRRTPGELALAVILVIIVAFAEETMFRGYLILRLHATTRNLLAAVILSTVIFSFGHGYEGSAGVVTVGFMGLAFALVYVWRKSLIAPMVMHFLQDFIVIVLIPALHRK
jgi:uncharacterized protein